MIKILFICHGNICRSTMAQSVFAHLAAQGRERSTHPAQGAPDDKK